jgi:hypothetical protein
MELIDWFFLPNYCYIAHFDFFKIIQIRLDNDFHGN